MVPRPISDIVGVDNDEEMTADPSSIMSDRCLPRFESIHHVLALPAKSVLVRKSEQIPLRPQNHTEIIKWKCDDSSTQLRRRELPLRHNATAFSHSPLSDWLAAGSLLVDAGAGRGPMGWAVETPFRER
jgi:hypothetical protein